jgi:hypothetical protein
MRTDPEFVFATGLGLRLRFALIAALAVVGIGLQLFSSIVLGWVFVLVGVLFGAMRGKSNRPELTKAPEWQNVTVEEMQAAQALLEKAGSVQSAAGPYNLTSAGGCGLIVFMAIVLIVVAAVVGGMADGGASGGLQGIAYGGSVTALLVIDGLTLFLPLWVFGRVRAWQPPNLAMRMSQLWSIYGRIAGDPGLEFQPSLQVAESAKGSVPMDAKLMVKMRDADPGFMGIQVQTSLNDVQGRKYPYTYCVLIAKPEFGLLGKASRVVEMPPRGGFCVGFFADTNTKKEAKFAKLDGAVVEMKTEGDVEIVVVRQGTGGRGYTTDDGQAFRVFSIAYGLARSVLKLS